jgi:hypothetical protein
MEEGEMIFHGMKRKQLQALCKKHGILANKSNAEMAHLLTLTLKVCFLLQIAYSFSVLLIRGLDGFCLLISLSFFFCCCLKLESPMDLMSFVAYYANSIRI